jgi:hypothetical protein
MVGPTGVCQAICEAGPGVDLDEQARDLKERQASSRDVAEGFGSFGELVGL